MVILRLWTLNLKRLLPGSPIHATLTLISIDMLIRNHSHKYMPANPSFIFFQAVFHFCPPCTEVHILAQGKATKAF